MSSRNLIAAASVLFALSPAFAQYESGISHASLQQNDNTVLPTGWKPFFGLSSGYMTQGGSAETEGVPTSFKALGSYYTDNNWVFDMGGGIQYQSMSNHRSPTVPMVEASARYILPEGWQAGPILNTYLTESNRYGSANSNFTSFAGVAVDKDFMWNEVPLRAGFSAMTDLDIRGENVALVVANLQMTFGGGRQPQVVDETPRAADHLIRAAVEPPPQKPLANFALESDRLNDSDKAYLRRVANLLKMNASQFNKVTLVGHTDPTGIGAKNQKLSVARAQSVRSFLVAQGVPESKLNVAGKAALEPISTVLDPNRRVEIRFSSGAPVTLEKSLRAIE